MATRVRYITLSSKNEKTLYSFLLYRFMDSVGSSDSVSDTSSGAEVDVAVGGRWRSTTSAVVLLLLPGNTLCS